MATIDEVFAKAENGTFTLEEFKAAAKELGSKFADLSEGGYVSKNKYDADLATKDTQINELNNTISTRDNDLEDLRGKLATAGEDSTKLETMSQDLATLQQKYKDDTAAYEAKMAKQSYEFAVREFAGSKKFTSAAAKRDFIQSMIGKELKMEGDKILGADDFVTAYTTDNADAFVVDTPDPTPEPPEPPKPPLPSFVHPTGGKDSGSGGDANPFQFNFTGVRAHE